MSTPTTPTPTATATPTGPTKKTYTPLIELPDVLIGRCVQVLPNRLQCWRGADFLIEEELPTPPAKPEPKTGDKEPAKKEEIKTPTPSLKQQQGAAPGEPGSGSTSEQKEQQEAGKKAAPATRSYQLCAMHATIQQRADTLAEQEAASGKTPVEDSDPKSIHSRMMQAEQRQRTSGMPSGESTAQR